MKDRTVPPPKPLTARLRESFRERFQPGRKKGTGRDTFFGWVRNVREPRLEVSNPDWTAMLRGESVSYDLIEAYSEFLTMVCGSRRYTVSRIAEVVRVPGREGLPDESHKSLWEVGWNSLYYFCRRGLYVYPDSFCRGEEDVAAAAALGMAYIGRSNHPGIASDDDDAAVAAGAGVMKRSLAELTAWLTVLWKFNRNSVMFGVVKRGNTYRRVGVSVIYALAEHAYAGLRDGRIADTELTPSDLKTWSPHIHVSVIGESPGPPDAKVDAVQVCTVIYQIAMQAPLSRYPALLTIGGTPASLDRAKAFGFRPTGTVLRGFDKPMLEYAPPGRGRTRDLIFDDTRPVRERVRFGVFYQAVSFFQLVFGDEIRRREGKA